MRLYKIKSLLIQYLEREGEEFHAEVWEILIDRRHVANAQEDLALCEPDLDDVIGKLASHHADMAAAQAAVWAKPKRRRHSEEPHENIPADERLDVVSDVFALQASERQEVISFRRKHFDGKQLIREDVDSWVKQQSERDGKPQPFVYAPLPDAHDLEHDFAWSGVGRIPMVVSPTLELDRVTGTKWEFLAYQKAGVGGVSRQVVRPGGVLDALRELSVNLVSLYGWSEDQASTFVLTGITPTLAQLRVTRRYRWPSGLHQLVLEVDPHMDPQHLLSVYRRYRRESLSGRYRRIDTKHRELVRFWASHTGGTWTERMTAWNKQFPDWRYDDYRNFWRDCNHSARNLLGDNFYLGEKRGDNDATKGE